MHSKFEVQPQSVIGTPNYEKPLKTKQVQLGSEIQPSKIRKHLKSGLFEGRTSNGVVYKRLGYYFSVNYGPNHSKSILFCPDIKWFCTNGRHLSGFQMVGFPDLWPHSKSKPFANQSLFNHLSPDFRSHCILLIQKPDFFCRL